MAGEVGEKSVFTRLYNPHREIMIKWNTFYSISLRRSLHMSAGCLKVLCFQCNTLRKYVIHLILCLFVDDFDSQYDKNVDAQVKYISK